MESGWIMALLLSSVIGPGAVAGVAMMNGDMMQNDMTNGGMTGDTDCGTDGMHHMHKEMRCDQYFEHHEECEEHMEEWENEHSFENEDHEENGHCGMMG